MIQWIENRTTVLFMTLAALLVLLSAGCKQEKSDSSEPAEPADAADVDLSQAAPDLFEEPIKPNPLAREADDVVITVEGEDITHGDIMQGVQMSMMQMSRQVPPQQLQQMAGQIYQNVSDTMVANILLTQAAETSGLAVTDEEVNAEIEKIRANLPEGRTLEDMLAENEVDVDEWKENMREQMLVRKLVEEKTADAPEATAAEVAAFYEENADSFKVPETVSASHILISFDEEDTPEIKAEKRAELESIQQELATGASFEELATEHSDCPSSAEGGALGTFTRGQMVPEFEEAAFALEPGRLSQIVETEFGYHIIKVTDHQKAGVRSLAEVKDQLQQYITNQNRQEALMAYIEELKADADVEFHKPDLDAGDLSADAE